MSCRPASFTQADVARALRAAEQVATGKIAVEIAPGGVIRIVPIEAHPGSPANFESALPEDPFARGLESVP